MLISLNLANFINYFSAQPDNLGAFFPAIRKQGLFGSVWISGFDLIFGQFSKTRQVQGFGVSQFLKTRQVQGFGVSQFLGSGQKHDGYRVFRILRF